MSDEKIIIPAKRLKPARPDQRVSVKISPKAYNMLVELANESGRPMNRVATAIIVQAVEKDLITLERCYEPEGDD